MLFTNIITATINDISLLEATIITDIDLDVNMYVRCLEVSGQIHYNEYSIAVWKMAKKDKYKNKPSRAIILNDVWLMWRERNIKFSA